MTNFTFFLVQGLNKEDSTDPNSSSTLASKALAVEVPAVAEVRSAVHGAEEGRDVVVGDLLALPDGHVGPALHVVVRVHGVPERMLVGLGHSALGRKIA